MQSTTNPCRFPDFDVLLLGFKHLPTLLLLLVISTIRHCHSNAEISMDLTGMARTKCCRAESLKLSVFDNTRTHSFDENMAEGQSQVILYRKTKRL